MRTNTEQEGFNWKAFLLTFTIFVAIFGLLRVSISPFDSDKPIDIFWLLEKSYWALIYPIIMAASFTSSFRKASIVIGDFHSIPDFTSKLLSHLEKFKVMRSVSMESEIQYLPTAKFRKLFNNWFDAERITVSFSSEEIKVTGPAYRITQLEDTLKWNKDFKA